MAESSKIFQIRLPSELYDKLERRARAEAGERRASMTRVAIKALERYLDGTEKGQPQR